MKKITLIILSMAFFATSFSQDCLKVLSSTSFTYTSSAPGDTTRYLTINYTTDGNKSLHTIVKCDNTVILDDCFSTNGSGTKIYPVVCAGGTNSLSAILQPQTGSCSGASCGPAFYVLPPGGGPLPVKLSSFFAKRNNNMVALNWKTETEINSKEFILESKTGNNFISVATIAALNRSSGSSYSFADNNTNKGITLYRLKIVDMDGSFTYSNISAVRGTSSVSNFTVFPNPSSGNAKVTISDISEPTDVQLIDLSGRVIKNITILNNNSVELNSMQKGMYMIRIINKNSGESVTQKLTVVN